VRRSAVLVLEDFLVMMNFDDVKSSQQSGKRKPQNYAEKKERDSRLHSDLITLKLAINHHRKRGRF